MADGPVLYDEDILVQDNLILKMQKGISDKEADKVIDCSSCVLMPGFKNAHAHSAMTFARSTSDNLSLKDWLYKCIFPMENKIQKNDIYHLTKGAYLEYLTSGITACYDMYYAPDEIAKAAMDFNFRTAITATSAKGKEADIESEKMYLNINGLHNPLVKYNFGFHAVYTSTPEQLEGLSMLAHKYQAPVSTHCSETKEEVETCKEKHEGLTPIRYFEKMHLLDYGGTLFHNVVIDAKDIQIMKKRNVIAVTCPGSNAKLASGIAPITKLYKAGIKIAIGTDGPGSNNCLDMFKEMSLLFSLEKLKDKKPMTIPAYTILEMATVNGAKAMGLENCDVLKEGKYADIIAIDLDRPNMQPVNNIIANIVYSGSKDNIKMTMINGRVLYLDHKFYLNEDYKEIYAKQQEIADRLNSVKR